VLTDEDSAHYQKIVVALSETIHIMAETDRTHLHTANYSEAFE